MKFVLLVLFFAHLKSSKDIYENLLEVIKQKIKTESYSLIDLKEEYYSFEVYIEYDKIVCCEYMGDVSGPKDISYKSKRIKYNTADEAIQKICDYYLSSNLNKLLKFPAVCKLVFLKSKHDIKLNLKNFFYNRIEPDFIARLYDSSKLKQIRKLCLCFSRSKMIFLPLCFQLGKDKMGGNIQFFEEENKMKFFFPVKLRNLMFLFKIDAKDLYTVGKKIYKRINKVT
ncbi:hypothetical protein NCER_102454 [Vairimorpha ceranae BRL01]|uniref:Uncharacterized protein n=1 Tax=Vairimorpha ceranae (strain BRL01) TaxID=578460 RepID=C4VC16_VAIC1|nr:hypothetical protein NCER_102454 [Vairimorpha ceranae BRL01]